MRKFNFKLVNGQNLNAEIVESDIVFENIGKFRIAHLLALKGLYAGTDHNFILDLKTDIVIPNKTFLHFIEELEDETGYIHTRKTVDVVAGTRVLNDIKQ